MLHAAMAVSTSSPQAVLIMGTDCPTLRPHHLRAAAEALEDVDAVFIPAEDGGYVLVGLRQPHQGLFAGMTWSTDGVMAQTRQRATSLSLRIRELPAMWDVDTAVDLLRLQALEALTDPQGHQTDE